MLKYFDTSLYDYQLFNFVYVCKQICQREGLESENTALQKIEKELFWLLYL